jgi:hypothetical protein
MSKVIVDMTLSVDGFIAGPNVTPHSRLATPPPYDFTNSFWVDRTHRTRIGQAVFCVGRGEIAISWMPWSAQLACC